MITKTITLIRHGESEGNVDKSIYRSKPDYALRLTQKGFEQAVNLGKEIRNLHDCEFIGMEPGIYCSPFWRARDTLQGLKLGLGKGFNPRYIYEDSRLREQEWGGGMGCDFDYNVEKERDSTGHLLPFSKRRKLRRCGESNFFISKYPVAGYERETFISYLHYLPRHDNESFP